MTAPTTDSNGGIYSAYQRHGQGQQKEVHRERSFRLYKGVLLGIKSADYTLDGRGQHKDKEQIPKNIDPLDLAVISSFLMALMA
jgi:hypothetical protein